MRRALIGQRTFAELRSSSISTRIARRVVVASIALATFAAHARAQAPTYELTFLGTAPGALATFPSAVNDQGRVACTAIFAGVPQPCFASRTQPPTLMHVLTGDVGGITNAINNAGVIVGLSRSPSLTFTAVQWTPTPSGYVVSALPPTAQGVMPRIAMSINEVGDIVGELTNGNGFAWSAATGTIDLATLGFTGIARGINESRQVVGGHDLIDLDTNVVQTASPPLTNWNFTFINDAGVAATYAQLAGGLTSGGIYEFGVGFTAYGIGGPGFVAGLDYATDVPYSTMTGSPVGNVIHYDGFGDFTLASRIDPSTPGWSLDYLSGFGMSASGVITVMGAKSPLSGPLLLEPQRIHAIIEGAPGATGLPVLTGAGSLVSGSPVTFKLSRAAPSAPIGLIAGLARVDLPFYGGVLVPAPTLVLTGLSTDANGKLTLATTWPIGIPSGTKVYLQEWIVDANAPFGIAGSNALECVVP